MEIHFYESIYTLVNREGSISGTDVYYTSWCETEEAINKGQKIIRTTQMGMLSTALCKYLIKSLFYVVIT